MVTIPIHPVPAGHDAATQFFSNYTRLEPRVPMAVWYAARALMLATALLLAALLVWRPATGLALFWGLAVPLLPAVLVVAPGLWRQVCPMATMNQLPRLLGRGRARELPAAWKSASFGIAVGLFVLAVALRRPLLNQSGAVVGIGIVAALALALAGGIAFKGRSGWCGTFCPLAPVQRVYGQAPLVLVRNGYCNPCVGCQSSCYDFNPRAAVFRDLYDDDPRHAAQRRLFMGLLPGLVLGYFLQADVASAGQHHQLLWLLAACCTSAGLYGLVVAFTGISAYRVALAFGTLAISLFYWFSVPLAASTLGALFGVPPSSAVLGAARATGIAIALALLASGLRAESRYRLAQLGGAIGSPAPAAPAATAADPGRTRFGDGRALKLRLAPAGAAEVTDRETGIAFQAGAAATLLESIEAAGLKIGYGCRAGVCGADAVRVCAGAENLSPPGDDELTTLRRLGLEGQARLACMCRVSGPVLIDRDPHAPAPSPAGASPAGKAVGPAPTRPAIDPAARAGIRRVLIVGNGIAGTSAAEALRRASPSVEITLLASEPYPFYNRMAIARLLHDPDAGAAPADRAVKALQLVPDDWAQRQRVSLRGDTVATAIDRGGQRLAVRPLGKGSATGDAQWLPYDRLVLATGARCRAPDERFLDHDNAFVLRTADDALALRGYVRARQARRAVVLGGGPLGVEAAEALQRAGLRVTLLQRADRLMPQQLDDAGAARLQAYLDSTGIAVATGVTVQRWDADDALLTAVWLSHGPRVRADLFVACLGIEPNVYLAEAAGLAVDGGIVVDGAMRTTDQHIVALGDCARVAGSPQGLWSIAAAQVQPAVQALFGDPLRHDPPAMVIQLKSDGIDVRSAGRWQPRDGDELFQARADEAAWWRLALRQGIPVGGLYVGPPGSAMAFTRLLQRPVDVAPLREPLRQGSLAGLAQLLDAPPAPRRH